MTNAEVVRAVVRGDGRASRVLWQRLAPAVRAHLRRALGAGDADDLVQEVFLRLYRALPALRDPAALPAFAKTVTDRVIRTELRRRCSLRWLRLSDDGRLPDRPAPAADHDAREALERLHRVARLLPPAERRLFVLRRLRGVELARVARATGVSLATVKRRLADTDRRALAHIARDPVLRERLRSTPTSTSVASWSSASYSS